MENCKNKNCYFNEDMPLEEYENSKNAGDVSKELGVPVGAIGCPHCGHMSIGAVKPICNWCDSFLFSTYFSEYITKMVEESYYLRGE